MSEKSVALEDSIRDLINWLAVYQEEFGIPEEAVEKLREKLEELAKKASTC